MLSTVLLVWGLWWPSLGENSRPDTVFISDRSACSSCKIELAPVVTLGGTDPPAVFLLSLSVVRLPSGDYVTTGLDGAETVAIFSPDGRLRRHVGRIGQGPGEWIQPVRVALGNDSLFIVDIGTRRVSVLSFGGTFGRALSTTQTQISDLIELPNGDLLASGVAFSREGSGYSLHGLARRTGVIHPIGDPIPLYDPRKHFADIRRLVSESRSGVWSSRINQYVIEKRTNSGELRAVLARTAGWFTPWQVQRAPSEGPGHPAVIGTREDPSGRLWVFAGVERGSFTPIIRRHGDPSAADVPLLNALKNRDTRIEVLDPDKGELLTSWRTQGLVRPIPPFPLVMRVEENRDGLPVVRVYEARLITAPVERQRLPDSGSRP